ncbi:MAG: VPLPA-CTERM sorting domain-containing protein [Pseudomonadota bacterium]
MVRFLFAATCAAFVSLASTANATTYSFFWTSASAESSIGLEPGEVVTATGTLTFAQSFTELVSSGLTTESTVDIANEVSALSITVSSSADSFMAFTLDKASFINTPSTAFSVFEGSFTDGGNKITVADLWGEIPVGNPEGDEPGLFGCNGVACAEADGVNIYYGNVLYDISGSGTTTADRGSIYVTASDALASYEIYRIPEVPLPAGLPLLLAGLAAFAVIRRRPAS